MRLITKHKVECFRNQKLYDWYQSLPNQHDVEVAVKTVSYIKMNYPEFKEILVGELQWVEEK